MARLYVGNLPHLTAEDQLQAWIEEHGFRVESVQVIRDLDTGTSRGFAFVELPEVLRAQEAVDALNGQKMEGHILRISESGPQKNSLPSPIWSAWTQRALSGAPRKPQAS